MCCCGCCCPLCMFALCVDVSCGFTSMVYGFVDFDVHTFVQAHGRVCASTWAHLCKHMGVCATSAQPTGGESGRQVDLQWTPCPHGHPLCTAGDHWNSVGAMSTSTPVLIVLQITFFIIIEWCHQLHRSQWCHQLHPSQWYPQAARAD